MTHESQKNAPYTGMSWDGPLCRPDDHDWSSYTGGAENANCMWKCLTCGTEQVDMDGGRVWICRDIMVADLRARAEEGSDHGA